MAPTRVGYDMSVGRGGGRCAVGAAVPLSEGNPLGAIGHECVAPTDGLFVYLPFGERHQWLRVPVCRIHIRMLWRNFGESRGEPEWEPNPLMHDYE